MSPEAYVRALGWNLRNMKWVHHRFAGKYTLTEAVAVQKAERLDVLAFELGVRVSDVRDIVLGRTPALSRTEEEKAAPVLVGSTWIPAPNVQPIARPVLPKPAAPKLPPLPTPPDDPPPPAKFETPPAASPPVVQESPTLPSDADLPRAIEPYQTQRRPFPPMPPPVVVGCPPPPEPVVEELPLLATLLKATRSRRRRAITSFPPPVKPTAQPPAPVMEVPKPPAPVPPPVAPPSPAKLPKAPPPPPAPPVTPSPPAKLPKPVVSPTSPGTPAPLELTEEVEKLALAAAPPTEKASRYAKILPMLPGAGDRKEDCLLYEDHLNRAYKLPGDAHCPVNCPEYKRPDRSTVVSFWASMRPGSMPTP